MARPISDEELQLKKRARRRLVGAIVLVTVVAVVLPMVLDSEPKPVSHGVNIQIPSPDSGEFKPKGTAGTTTAAAPSEVKPIKGLPEAPPKPEAPARSEPPKSEPAPPAATADASRPKEAAKAPEAKMPPKETMASGAFVVQVAALADKSKASQLEQRVAGAGLKTYTDTVSTQAGELTRVRAGPYPSREAAEKARTQLKKAGIDGQVVPR